MRNLVLFAKIVNWIVRICTFYLFRVQLLRSFILFKIFNKKKIYRG